MEPLLIIYGIGLIAVYASAWLMSLAEPVSCSQSGVTIWVVLSGLFWPLCAVVMLGWYVRERMRGEDNAVY